ncbi:MAG: hypothetical protein INR69_19780 [Mucilaginibacter polytrichastri]|nr:hypothetical protein [Mucilaginibacter polytrichastri]
MKSNLRIPFFTLTMISLLTACAGTGIEEKIPGTYTSEVITSSSSSRDTLMINPEPSGEFRVVRRGTYVRSSPTLPDTGTTCATFTGRYDAGTGALSLTPHGKTIRIDPDGQQIRLGSRVYQRNPSIHP